MSKPLLLLQAPIGTQSGYGERSRDLARALIALDKYDVKIISTRWGTTPMTALTDQDQDILSLILTQPLTQQPDIYMQVTVPNEFQRLGKFNIGVTAGIETNVCDPSWVEGCNRMDLILVSSEHAKKVFENSVYTKLNEQRQPIAEIKLQKPVEVLFEGIRLDKFKKSYTGSEIIDTLFKDVKEDFAFLFVGNWLPGGFSEDRKNISGLIKTFYESFKNKQKAPALVLKTSSGSCSVMDKEYITKKIKEIKATVDATTLPNIYVVYGDLTDAEMNDLYNHPKVKSHVSFTKGEGFGRPLLEAALTSKPVIASNWSGQVDFLKKDFAVLLDGTQTNVHPSAAWQGVLNTDATWFTVDYAQAAAYLKDIFKNYKSYTEKSRKAYHYIKTNFSFDLMQSKLNEILNARVPDFPKQVQLQLPKLKKIELPKLKKI
jgi:glycosyltransferase involved in cell wall biosynthesis